MKRKVIITFSSIIGTIVLILILMFTGIIPNIFVDRSDLTCSRVYVQMDNYRWDDAVVINFNNIAVAKSGTKQIKFIYEDESLAKENYEQVKQDVNNIENTDVVLEGSTVVVNKNLELSLDQLKMKKKEIKKVYEELGYECR